MIKESLGGSGWKMKTASGKIYDATVPASVMSVLLDAGEMQDPYYRENEKEILPLFEKDYEFFRNFSINGTHVQADLIELVFYGLDTLADIYLNNKLLASVSDMHRTYRYSVKDLVRMGSNELRIVLHSPLAYLRSYKPAEGKESGFTACGAISGNQYLRKAHSMFGWDWGPKLPDAGIFRDVELCCYSKARLEDVVISQEHRRDGVMLTIDPVLRMFDNIPVEIEVTVTGQKPVSVLTRMPEGNGALTSYGENRVQVLIENPELWWPNGLGGHTLYTVQLRVKKADYLYDEKTLRIGLRTLTVSREKDTYGEEFAFCVNGVKIFAMGADYIPEDCIYPRITKERIKQLVEAAARANYNCLRVWGGGYYPSDEFYDFCDENGIIVWQDLMYACNVYELTPDLEENIVAEAKDNVGRLRHHACLGLWCGNNELESGWDHWPDFQKEKLALKADYIKMFEYLLPKAVKETDVRTFYWPSSPSSGGCFDEPDDENRGDAHYWDVWHGQKPFTEYKNHYFRFCSEFGFQSFPSMKTVRSFTEPEDLNIFSPVMESHQKNGWANGKILYYLSETFRYPKDFESLLYVSQMLQGLAIKYGVEHFRQNRGRCMGALYWQMNDNWPVVSWSSIDYYGRWKALHYMASRFYAPVAGSIVKRGKKLLPYVDNGSLADVSCHMELSLRDMDGTELSHFKNSKRCYHGKTAVFEEYDFGRMLEKYGERNVYAEAVFTYGDGVVQVEAETFVPYKHLALKPATIQKTITEEEDLFRIILTTDVFAPFVFLDLKDADGIFSDNAFHMTPGFDYEITLAKADIFRGEIKDVSELTKQLTVRCLQDSYMEEKKPEVIPEQKMEMKVTEPEIKKPETKVMDPEMKKPETKVSEEGIKKSEIKVSEAGIKKPEGKVPEIKVQEHQKQEHGKVSAETASAKEEIQNTAKSVTPEREVKAADEKNGEIKSKDSKPTEEYDEEKAIQEVLGQLKRTVQQRREASDNGNSVS